MRKTAKSKKEKVNLIFDLVDIAILPAALLICAKALGIAILNTILGLDWSIQSVASSIFSVKLTYDSASDAQLVNSYTNLFMYIVVLSGAMVVTSKSLLFHHKKASPYFVLKLAKHDLLHLLRTSIHIYKEVFVWGVFLITTTLYILVSLIISGGAGYDGNYGWIAGISVLFTITYLWITVQNIEEEMLYSNYKA